MVNTALDRPDETVRNVLGQLYGVSNAWEGGRGPSIEELKHTVHTRCIEQIGASEGGWW